MLLEADRNQPRADISNTAFLAEVLRGLSSCPRAISARWFYDDAGSELFEEITRLPEYYPTRTEAAMLRQNAPDIAQKVGLGRAVVEFGSGSSSKTPLLLNAVDPVAYIPIDISGDFLRTSAAALAEGFPGLPVLPIEADFLHPIGLPPRVTGLPRLGFFPGSTIGNLTPDTAVDLLRAMADTLGHGSMLLIGMDRVKSLDILIPAYDDAAGVTARFNLNLLHRINRELGGDIPVANFRHRAIWNEDASRIEMHLEAMADCSFQVAGRPFAMKVGETIHTENSHKYAPRDARLLLRAGGWTPVAEYSDPDEMFMLILAEAQPAPVAP